MAAIEQQDGMIIDESKQDSRMNFADEIIIDDQHILTISAEKMFEEPQKRTRKSRWGGRPDRKCARPEQKHLQFNPLEAMMNRKCILPVGAQSLAPPVPIGMALPWGMQPMPVMPVMPQPYGYNFVRTDTSHTRWGPEYEKTFQPPSLNCIPPDLSIDDLEYIIRLYCLDDINQKLQQPIDSKMDDPDLRSPSPEPVYDQHGKRVNTREVRRKENFQRIKCSLTEECIKINKNFVPPYDFKPLKKSQKIYLTDTLNAPDTNYIGLILGPGGNTQKFLEGKTGCKISVRGKGSSNTKKVDWDMDDKLHVLIQADNDEQLQQGVIEIEKILSGNQEDEQARNARLQGQVIATVLRDDFCEYCHEKGHRTYACPTKIPFEKARVKCEICHEFSHPTSDCPQKFEHKESFIQQQYDKYRKDLGLEKNTEILSQDNQNEKRTTEQRVAFITNAQIVKPIQNLQIEDDKFIMERLRREQQERDNYEKAQKKALEQYTLQSQENQNK
ncbi:unnamed protein product [Paramecium octaurelia]|uniref:Branchpoint-bridging protein n=1 Tax=Paramecium octaurelia TaxID=43137 RepID=A0A8S1V9M9_PAROT|nr:unnamed protein product [Paramecium octaurelia]